MKINILLAGMLAIGISSLLAKPVTPILAQQIAQSYYKQNNKIKSANLTLAYTQTGANGLAVYYAFNVNTTDGFVIVAADDAAHPIIGYSTKNQFVIPEDNTPIGHWLKKRKVEVDELRAKNLTADESIKNEWAGTFAVNSRSNLKTNSNASTSSASSFSVTPLVQSTWNQNGGGTVGYNNLCPSGSVTGCVATAMAQIMKYWNYPTHGIGSSSYCDCTADSLGGTPFTNTYGTLSANYAATTYSWSTMPLTSSNAVVATLMYHCGVSVDMDYDPSGSGAWVITADDSICAQTSYVKYFGYDPYTIQGLIKANYTDAAWVQLLQNDLINDRPIQYVGDDPAAGGHTWVCDGFDINNNFHMNWGWGGSNNGYFFINNLNSGNGNFSTDCEALIGIEPLPARMADAGVPAFTNPVNSIACSTTFAPSVNVQNFGTNVLTSCVLNYKLDGNTISTQNWSGSLTPGQIDNIALPQVTITAGTHTLTCYTSNPNGVTDSNAVNNQSISIFTYGVAAAFAANQTSICYVPVLVQFINNTTNATNYIWSFGDGTVDISLNPSHTYTASGTYSVKLVSSACNGAVADSVTTTITINTPAGPVATSTTTCDSSTATLTASGTGTLIWKDAQGTQVGTGTSFITPTLTANTTYFVCNTNPVAAINGAPAINTTLGAGGYINAAHSLIFNANAAFTLQTVDIYAQSAGGAPSIQLLDNSGNILQTVTPTLSSAGKNTVTLNWLINPGTGYQLTETGATINLYRNSVSSSIAYPINVGTLASITGNDVADLTRYYYFYNWKVQSQACASADIPVTATVQQCTSATGIKNISPVNFELYPNPTNGNVTLSSSLSLGLISVYNAIGQLIHQQKTNNTFLQLDLSSQAAGIYVVQVQNKFLRIIKQ
jgi:PKD repeat protein